MGISSDIKNLKNITGLSDSDIILLTSKFQEIKEWKDIAVIQIKDIKDRLDVIEERLDVAQTAFISLRDRVKVLEDA